MSSIIQECMESLLIFGIFNDWKDSSYIALLLDRFKNFIKRFLCGVAQICLGRITDAATTFWFWKIAVVWVKASFNVHLCKCVSWSTEACWAFSLHTLREIHSFIWTTYAAKTPSFGKKKSFQIYTCLNKDSRFNILNLSESVCFSHDCICVTMVISKEHVSLCFWKQCYNKWNGQIYAIYIFILLPEDSLVAMKQKILLVYIVYLNSNSKLLKSTHSPKTRCSELLHQRGRRF